VWRIVLVTAAIVAGALSLFLWEYHRDGDTLEEARTIAVNVLVMGELVYLFNSRFLLASSLSLRGFFGNRYAVLAVAALIPLQLAFTYVPVMQALFGTAAIDAEGWGRVLAFGAALFLLVEAEKAVLRWRQARASRRLLA
jgi:magnesium-transporting ATPase (P-type)